MLSYGDSDEEVAIGKGKSSFIGKPTLVFVVIFLSAYNTQARIVRYDYSGVRNIISRSRFEQILWFLRFSDNATEMTKYDLYERN